MFGRMGIFKFRAPEFQPPNTPQKVRRDVPAQLARQRFGNTLELSRFAYGEALGVKLSPGSKLFPDRFLEQKGFRDWEPAVNRQPWLPPGTLRASFLIAFALDAQSTQIPSA